jgi:hypothetical protein
MQAPPKSRVQAFEANASGAWFRPDPIGLPTQAPLLETSKFHSASSVHYHLERKHSSPLERALLAAPAGVVSDTPPIVVLMI